VVVSAWAAAMGASGEINTSPSEDCCALDTRNLLSSNRDQEARRFESAAGFEDHGAKRKPPDSSLEEIDEELGDGSPRVARNIAITRLGDQVHCLRSRQRGRNLR
jgi:hypothetical protein